MEEPKLEDYGITQREFQQYKNRSTYLPEGFYSEYIRYTFTVLFIIVAVPFYYHWTPEEDFIRFGKIGAIFVSILRAFWVGIMTFPIWLSLEIIINKIVKSIDSYFYKKAHPMYREVKGYREAKAQYASYIAKREEERRQREEQQRKQKEEQERQREEERKHREEQERLAQKRKERERWLSFIGHGKAFEKEIANLYSSLGYQVVFTSRSSDQGIDLILRKDDKKIIVQCKAHKKPNGPEIARDLYGTLISNKADEAILVSISGFTHGVRTFVKDKPIKLISLDDLIQMQKSIKS